MTDSLSTIRHLLNPVGGGPISPPTEIYRSTTGDLWELFRGEDPSRRVVLHTPAAASGGKQTLVTVEEFLALNSAGPEHAALRILLAKPESTSPA